MCFMILFHRVVAVIGDNNGNSQFLMQTHDALVHRSLSCNAMILHLQEIVVCTKEISILTSCLTGSFIVPLHEIFGHFTCQAGGEAYQSFMVLLQGLHIHAWLIVETIDEALRADLHQILITFIGLRQQDQMIVTVLILRQVLIQTGARSHVNLTA